MARGDVTRLLAAVNEGDRRALDRLYELVHSELRRMAAGKLRGERAGHTLQPTALVSEAYLRLAPAGLRWNNRRQFFGAAAVAMRRILVDHARRAKAGKRGGGAARVTLDDGVPAGPGDDPLDVMSLHSALEALEAEDPALAELVTLRYFAGLDIAQTAKALDVSPATVKRDWTFARAWLLRRLTGGQDGSRA